MVSYEVFLGILERHSGTASSLLVRYSLDDYSLVLDGPVVVSPTGLNKIILGQVKCWVTAPKMLAAHRRQEVFEAPFVRSTTPVSRTASSAGILVVVPF